MYTQCPQCSTVFRVQVPILREAKGMVRCSRCQRTFNALDTLMEELPNIGTPASKDRPADADARIESAHYLEDTEQLPDQPPPAQQENYPDSGLPQAPGVVSAAAPTGENGEDTPALVVNAEDRMGRPLLEPSFAKTSSFAPHNWRGTLMWSVAIITLTALLAGQYGYFKRDELAHYPQVRPWLEQLCELTGCEIARLKDPSQITFLARDIQSHPNVANALLTTAKIRNEAPFVQAYPALQLSLYGLGGDLLGRRRFEPFEYLANIATIKHGLAPGASANISLELVDPGEKAVSYEFDLM